MCSFTSCLFVLSYLFLVGECFCRVFVCQLSVGLCLCLSFFLCLVCVCMCVYVCACVALLHFSTGVYVVIDIL